MNISFSVNLADGNISIDGHSLAICENMTVDGISKTIANCFNASINSLNGLYNKGVYWPRELEMALIPVLSKNYSFELTRHAHEKMEMLRLPHNEYPKALCGEIVEATVVDGVVQKVVTRVKNRKNPEWTTCYVIRFGNEFGRDVATVITVWANRTNDRHATIHSENYISPARVS